ncbi:unnamed protein product [Arabis nemorensis]|uniref:RPW8 domain-containing protein n=1 Tax=Arabis nemorensis TaxID=586526 RepID=A0A565BH17_9BRAS|nr:unnamed protein product [Arabis nemorensis]
MGKASEMVAGAFGGAIVSEIMKFVIAEAKTVLAFKYVSKDLASTMEDLHPIITKFESLQRVEQLKTLMDTIANARVLVQKCSGVQRWNLLKKYYYTRKIMRIQKEMVSFCQVQLQILQHWNQLQSMEEIKQLDVLMNEINTNHQILIKKMEDVMEALRVGFETKPCSLDIQENTSSSTSLRKLLSTSC